MHDGNHYPGVSKTADYKARAKNSLMNWTPSLLNWRNRVVNDGGSGAGTRRRAEGRQNAGTGLRDIPSPSITDVPVGVKFSA